MLSTKSTISQKNKNRKSGKIVFSKVLEHYASFWTKIPTRYRPICLQKKYHILTWKKYMHHIWYWVKTFLNKLHWSIIRVNISDMYNVQTSYNFQRLIIIVHIFSRPNIARIPWFFANYDLAHFYSLPMAVWRF